MRFSFACSTGWHIDAGSFFDKTAIMEALQLAAAHLKICPYCRCLKDPMTQRTPEVG